MWKVVNLMNKKRIMAILAIVLLVGLYVSTLVFALIDSPITTTLLEISVAGTIFIPVVLYAFILLLRLSNHDEEDEDENSKL